MTALARMDVAPELLASLLHLPAGVEVRGADYDAATDSIRLYLDGTPHPGAKLNPVFSVERVQLVDWGVR